MKTFDLIIIGGGAGAFAAAIRANELKAKTALINSGLPLGGTCVNVGCVPSKALLYAGEILHHAKHHGVPGIELEVKSFDFQKVVQDELSLVEKLRQEKYEKVLKNLEYVTAIEGKAKFVSKNEVEVHLVRIRNSKGSQRKISNGVNGPAFANLPAGKARATAGREILSAEKFIIATGSTANVPPIEGIREVGFVTHIEALRMERQPKELVVIGAGPLGLEFAQMFSRFGTKVTILQRGDSIFPPAEKILTDRLAEILAKEGITIKTNVEVKAAHLRQGPDGQARKVITYTQAGLSTETSVEADEILLAAGKTPNTQGLGLDVAGVEIDKRQAVIVNQNFQTSNPKIFAVGDVTNGPLRLEPTAGREGTLAAENALKGTALSIDYNTVPYTIFTDPQLAGVGFTEETQIKTIGVCACPVRDNDEISSVEHSAPNGLCTLKSPTGEKISNGACRTVSFENVPKAIIMRRTEGLIKMGIDSKTRQILGVHILAPNAGELIAEAMMLIKNKNTIDDVVNSSPVFPTLSEAIKIVALSFTKDINKLSCCV